MVQSRFKMALRLRLVITLIASQTSKRHAIKSVRETLLLAALGQQPSEVIASVCRLYLHRITSTVISELARGHIRPKTGPR